MFCYVLFASKYNYVIQLLTHRQTFDIIVYKFMCTPLTPPRHTLPSAAYETPPPRASVIPPLAPSPSSSSPSVIRPIAAGFLPSPNVTPTAMRVLKIAFENATPDKKFPLMRGANGRIILPLTPNTKKAANAIYMFRRKSDGKVLIGKTETLVRQRVSSYLTSFNKSASRRTSRRRGLLAAAVHANPEQFEFGVLYKLPPGQNTANLSALESAYITMKSALSHGFNQRRGGGGGHKLIQRLSADATTKLRRNIFATFQTPQKVAVKTRLTTYGKRFSVTLPASMKQAKNVVYVWKNTATGERYVGKTIRQLKARVAEHLHHANNPSSEAAHAPLYQGIRDNHKHFEVGILYKAPAADEATLDEAEKAFIEYYKTRAAVYNRR